MRALLAEHDELLRIVGAAADARVQIRTVGQIADGRQSLPLYAVSLGNPSLDAPAVGFFGGVHGLERVGTHVVLSFLEWLVTRLRTEEVQRLLGGVRLVFMPLVNPAGMRRNTRANANGVDLMRNAPVQSLEGAAFLLGGQRLSAALPWYRGRSGEPMQRESERLCTLVREELLSRRFSVALDCHSGFGLRDRVWFPYAHSRRPFHHLAEVHAMMRLFSDEHAHHPYLFEPQSRRYLAHGDLWDHLCAETAPGQVFLPLTLEMGSWRWVRKSPRQAFSKIGLFNPLPPDRLQRVKHNHMPWMRFLCDAAMRYRSWLPVGESRHLHELAARAMWFRKR